MAEDVVKQEISATRGTFEFRGIISNLDKDQEFDKKTQKGNGMRTLTFNVDTAEGHTHKMQLRAYQAENVYFSKTTVDKDGNRKNDVKQVKWNDRLKFNMEGYFPIDRVAFHSGVEMDENGKQVRKAVQVLTYDAIPEILKEFNVGDSIRITGNIQIEDYTMSNGNSGTAVRLVPTRIHHTTEPVDFTKADYQEFANFSQKLLVDEVEKTGTNEITVTGLIIGNQKMGRQDFIFRDEAVTTYGNLLQTMKNFPKYVCVELKGILNNGAAKDDTPQFVEIKGIKVPIVQSRPMGNNFVREFLTTSIVTGDDGSAIDWGDSYTEQNVQEFIDNFIRAKKEFGNSASADNTISADDYLF